MAANSSALPKHLISEEEDPRQNLMLDPRPREEMNRMVLEAMTTTTPAFRLTILILGVLTAVLLFGAWVYMIV
jgi:molybdopterin-containing oxidoreductase family membrane subunit